MRDTTAHEERMWEYYKAIEAENHHLKNQLVNKNKELRALKHAYNALSKKYKKLTDVQKPRFRNNGKAGK